MGFQNFVEGMDKLTNRHLGEGETKGRWLQREDPLMLMHKQEYPSVSLYRKCPHFKVVGIEGFTVQRCPHFRVLE